jgi:hypothetical protein
VVGAIAMMSVGFWGMGWTTASSAERVAKDRADTAVVAALVPFCVAKAQQDAEAAKMAKFRAESSSYTRTQLVSDSGWATFLGATSSPDYGLVRACAEKLDAALKAG